MKSNFTVAIPETAFSVGNFLTFEDGPVVYSANTFVSRLQLR